MQFEKYFKIWLTRTTTITLKQALAIAKQELFDMVYDPLGINKPESWWWCAAVLEVLQQEDFIREFEILKNAPKNQTIPSEAKVIY